MRFRITTGLCVTLFTLMGSSLNLACAQSESPAPGATPENQSPPAEHLDDPEYYVIQAHEEEFLGYLNAFRIRLGLDPVVHDQRLQGSAVDHSLWMSTHRYLTGGRPVHWGPYSWNSSSDRMTWNGIPKDALMGENVARGNFDAKRTFLQWLFSPDHMLLMISPEYRVAGVARRGCEFEWSKSKHCYWTLNMACLAEELPGTWNQEEHLEATELFSDQVILDAALKTVGDFENFDPKEFSQIPEPEKGVTRWKEKVSGWFR